MRKSKWLAVVLAAVMVLGLAGVVVGADGSDHPAAPAVAGRLLEEKGIDNRWGTGRDGGNYISEVARHMGPETDFEFPKGNVVSKSDVDAYELAIRMFLAVQGAAVLDGLVLWLDASILDLNDEDSVTTWTDRSGEGNHATQIATGKQPMYVAEVEDINDRPVVRFSTHVENNLVHPEIDTIDAFTYFVVWARPAEVNSQVLVYSKNAYPFIQYGDLWYVGHAPATVPMPNDVFQLNTGQMTPGTDNGKRWLNGDAKPSTNGFAAGNAHYRFRYIGYTGYLGPQGDIAEILIFNRALSDSERMAVEHYLKTKYGL